MLQGCLFDSNSDKIIGDYEAIWIDLPEDRSINKGEQIVPPFVYEIGHNSEYIIAKQHPVTVGSNSAVRNDTTNYWIIEVSENSFQDRPVYGPLSVDAFDSLRRVLNIENIQFDMPYREY